MLVMGMGIVLGLLTLMISARTVRQKIEMKTREGRMALLLQFLPLGILIGRNLWLYAADEAVLWAASVMIFIALQQISLITNRESLIAWSLGGLSLFTVVTTGLLTLAVATQIGLSASFAILLGSLLAAGMTYEISLRPGVNVSYYRAIAMTIIVLSCVFNVMIFGELKISVATSVIGAGLVVMSYVVEQRSISICGSALLLVGLINLLFRAFQWFDIGSWIILLIVGVAAIVIASVLDTHGEKIGYRLGHHKKQLADWNF